MLLIPVWTLLYQCLRENVNPNCTGPLVDTHLCVYLSVLMIPIWLLLHKQLSQKRNYLVIGCVNAEITESELITRVCAHLSCDTHMDIILWEHSVTWHGSRADFTD